MNLETKKSIEENLNAYVEYLKGNKPTGYVFLPYLCVMGNMEAYADNYDVRSHFLEWLAINGKVHQLTDDGDILLEKHDKKVFYENPIPKDRFLTKDNILKTKEERLSFAEFILNKIK